MSIVLPVTSDDLQLFRDPRTTSGWRHVYPHHRHRLWKAVAYRHQVRLGLHPNPREGAVAVVRWWKSTFGEQWRDAYEGHRQPAWLITRNRKADEGYRVFVWEFGRKRCLPPDDPQQDWFWTRQAALDHFNRWRRDRYGLWADRYWLFLNRSGGSDYEPFVRRPYIPPKPRRCKFPSPTPVLSTLPPFN